MDQNKISKFVKLIENSQKAVFFGGAGVSTESGMKDYRSKDGLYTTVKQYGVPPEKILSRSFFSQFPEVFYEFYYNYFLNTDVTPNRAHYALAELERVGKLGAVITQNVDGLHQKAGSKNVIELHGTVFKHYCPVCRRILKNEAVKALSGGIPRCPECQVVVRPDITLYEEQLKEEVTNDAINAIANADLLIIGGTSLAVYPAANLLRFFNGKDIVLINRDETSYDHNATLIFHDSIGEVLENTVKKLAL